MKPPLYLKQPFCGENKPIEGGCPRAMGSEDPHLQAQKLSNVLFDREREDNIHVAKPQPNIILTYLRLRLDTIINTKPPHASPNYPS